MQGGCKAAARRLIALKGGAARIPALPGAPPAGPPPVPLPALVRSKRAPAPPLRGGMKGKKRGVVEGFRVLTLLYRVDELLPEAFQRLKELLKAYRAVATLHFWSLRLGLKEGVAQALERAKELPSYWRKALDKGSPLYAFSEVEKMRLRKHVLKLPLTDALHPNNGAYIVSEGELVLRLGDRQRLELRALGPQSPRTQVFFLLFCQPL